MTTASCRPAHGNENLFGRSSTWSPKNSRSEGDWPATHSLGFGCCCSAMGLSTLFQRLCVEQRALRFRLTLRNILPHELAYHLRRWLAFSPPRLEEFVSKRTLDSDSQPYIFHRHKRQCNRWIHNCVTIVVVKSSKFAPCRTLQAASPRNFGGITG